MLPAILIRPSLVQMSWHCSLCHHGGFTLLFWTHIWISTKPEGTAHPQTLYLPARFAWDWPTHLKNGIGKRKRHRQTSWLYQSHLWETQLETKAESRRILEIHHWNFQTMKKKTTNNYYKRSLTINNQIKTGITKKKTKSQQTTSKLLAKCKVNQSFPPLSSTALFWFILVKVLRYEMNCISSCLAIISLLYGACWTCFWSTKILQFFAEGKESIRLHKSHILSFAQRDLRTLSDFLT